MSKAGPRWGIKANNVRNPRPVLTKHKIIHFDDVSVALKIVLHTMGGRSCLIAFVLTSVHLPIILSITTAIERNAPRNFRRHIDSPPTDWENGLRTAVYQMLIREGYSHPNLREYLSIAPMRGQRNTAATPFGDIAVLARGQLYLTNAGFAFIEDPNRYDCDECNEHQICGATSCRWSKPQHYGTLLALWTARRIRHRDRNYGHRYEVQYTVSPIYSDSRGTIFITKNGLFNYNIAGHVFVTKDKAHPTDYQALEQHGCKRCNHHENYVPAKESSYNQVRGYLPPHMSVMEVNPARSKGGFLLGMNPSSGKYNLQKLPNQDEAHKDVNAKHDLQKEIELYTRLLQSLATQRPQTESNKFTATKFIPSTTPGFMRDISPIESPSTESIPTIPYQTTFMDFVKIPKTSTVQLRPMLTTPSTQSYSKTTTVFRFPTPKTMTRLLTTPFRASPNYVRYSEPDPFYHAVPMMYTTPRKQLFSTSQKTTSSTVPVVKQDVTRMNVTTTKTTSPMFKTTKTKYIQYQTKPQSESAQSQENVTERQSFNLEGHVGTTIPYEQTSITSISTENEPIPQTLMNKTTVLYYEATGSSEQDQETTTVFNEDETDHRTEQNTEVAPTTEKILIRQEITHNTEDDDKTITTTVPTSSEIIQTQETLSIPHTTMNVIDDWIQSKLTTFVTDDNKSVDTLSTITFFNVKASEDFSTESSTPPQTTVHTTQQEHTTYLPHDVESTTLKTTDTPEMETQSSFHTTAIDSEIPTNTGTLQTTTDRTTTKTEKEKNLLDEIFGTVVTDRTTTMRSIMKHINTKEIDELFDEEILSEDVSDSELSTKRSVRIIFSNFYLAGPTTETTTDLDSTTQELSESSEYTTETTVAIPTSQSYSTSISFEVNKRNKSLNVKPMPNNEKVKAKLTEIKLNDTDFMVYKAELPEKKSELPDDKEMSASNTFDSIALMLVNHARSIDYVNKKHNETKPKRKYRKSKHHQKKI